ncbi:MAG TPA: MBL fold metallo-hydrolase [Thermoanaerobaculia bacterium]|nr:MBL fold metallo-hydrolase [Thermoanaerobaculia bacterium]
MRKLAFVVVLFLCALSAFAQQRDFSKVEVKAQKVAGTVYMLTGSGGNIGVSVGEDGIVIVDDQFAPLAPKIKEALKGITDKPIKFVLNTHYHGDHTGGNEVFGREAPIIAQTNVRKRLASGSTALGNTTPPAPKAALPVVTFDDKVTVHLNGEDIRAIHYPNGHTDGDAVIFFTQSNVVHMGDDFFNGLYPFIDIDNGGSVKGMIAGVRKVLAAVPDDVKVIPGHGPLSDKAGLRAFVEMLEGTSAAVEKGIKEGQTVEQLKQAKVLANWDSWSSGFINLDGFVAALYRDLSRK